MKQWSRKKKFIAGGLAFAGGAALGGAVGRAWLSRRVRALQASLRSPRRGQLRTLMKKYVDKQKDFSSGQSLGRWHRNRWSTERLKKAGEVLGLRESLYFKRSPGRRLIRQIPARRST